MNNKHQRTPAISTRPSTESLQMIDGIGHAIAQRLYNAGILTFAHLAVLSPDEVIAKIGSQAGLSAHRIAEENWIGQARVLAAQSSRRARKEEKPQIEPPSEEFVGEIVSETSAKLSEMMPHQRSAIFTVQLELRPDGSVRRTMVKHARTESGEEEPEQWLGWDAARLVSFIEQRTQLRQAPEVVPIMLDDTPLVVTQSLPPIQVEVESEYSFKVQVELPIGVPIPAEGDDPVLLNPTPILPAQTEENLKGVIRMSGLEIGVVGKEEAQNVLRSGKQLRLQIMLDLSNVIAPPDVLISYKAAVYAKQLDGPRRITLAEATGNIKMAESAQIELIGQELSSGIYRLTAITTLNTPNSLERSQLMAFLESGLVEVLN